MIGIPLINWFNLYNILVIRLSEKSVTVDSGRKAGENYHCAYVLVDCTDCIVLELKPFILELCPYELNRARKRYELVLCISTATIVLVDGSFLCDWKRI